MADIKPIVVYVHKGGPNPYKVTITLEELGIPYEKIVIEDPKSAEFVKINPNGRLPAIIDPNTDLTLWESGAIVEYIVETYDKKGLLKGATTNENWHIKQFVHFQMSGQGPYFGQAVWFHKFHPEQVPSAIERYEKEILRVVSVLDGLLEGKKFLVGEKLTYADIVFIPWNGLITNPIFKMDKLGEVAKEKYPNYVAWQERLDNLDSVKKAYGK